MMKAVILASAVTLLTFAAPGVPARAGQFTLTSEAKEETIEYEAVCITAAGERGSDILTIRPGETVDVGNDGCVRFEMRFSTANGVREDYAVEVGKSYRLFWNANRWDLEPG